MRLTAMRSTMPRVTPKHLDAVHRNGGWVALAAGCVGLSLLSGCAKPEVPVAAAPPYNPFASLRVSSLCQVTPVAIGPDGSGTAKVSVRSDDGSCAIKVAQPDNTAYASFVLTGLPDHGKAFIYNYYNATYIAYTATTAYAGPDHFVVGLIPNNGGPRTRLAVDVTVAAGVGVAPPVEATPAPAAEPKKSTTSSKHHTTTKKPVKKKTSSSSSSN